MNALDVLVDLARRPLESSEQLRPRLTAELLNAHPHHDNSIAWLLWHTGREIDIQLAGLTGAEQVWTAEGFVGRFALGVATDDIGYGHTPEQARAVIVTDPALLLDYLDATVAAQVRYIESLDDDDAGAVIDASWEPPVTRSARLVSISADAIAHVEQATYIAGMGAGAFE